MHILFSSACDWGEKRKGQEDLSRPVEVFLCWQMVRHIIGVLAHTEQYVLSVGAKSTGLGKEVQLLYRSGQILRERKGGRATWQEA